MIRVFTLLMLIPFLLICCIEKNSNEQKIRVKGLNEAVEIYRDNWGINHIYAKKIDNALKKGIAKIRKQTSIEYK